MWLPSMNKVEIIIAVNESPVLYIFREMRKRQVSVINTGIYPMNKKSWKYDKNQTHGYLFFCIVSLENMKNDSLFKIIFLLSSHYIFVMVCIVA